jgi:cobalt-zinc-cadmium efflux system membrane fusion protein
MNPQRETPRWFPLKMRDALIDAAVGAALVAVACAIGGCGSANQAGTMTSFSTDRNAATQAELFSLPADQMAHIQVVQVARGPSERALRLTGAVEYNGFKTTPVIT